MRSGNLFIQEKQKKKARKFIFLGGQEKLFISSREKIAFENEFQSGHTSAQIIGKKNLKS